MLVKVKWVFGWMNIGPKTPVGPLYGNWRRKKMRDDRRRAVETESESEIAVLSQAQILIVVYNAYNS